MQLFLITVGGEKNKGRVENKVRKNNPKGGKWTPRRPQKTWLCGIKDVSAKNSSKRCVPASIKGQSPSVSLLPDATWSPVREKRGK